MDIAPDVTVCPECGSDDLSFFGATEERTEADITDIIECAACPTLIWESSYADEAVAEIREQARAHGKA